MIETLKVFISIFTQFNGVDIFTVAEQILELFPLQKIPEKVAEGPDQRRIADRLKQVQLHSIVLSSQPVKDDDNEDVTRPGEYYRRHRTVEELPKDVRTFYDAAGELRISFDAIDKLTLL